MTALANDMQTAIATIAARIEPALIEIRRDIHAHPELAFEEVRTAGVVAAELTRLGIPHETGIGVTGVVGLIQGGRPGKVLIIRADMDALPIHEQTGQPFASTIPGKMHACGHDIHTTTLLGVAEVLRDLSLLKYSKPLSFGERKMLDQARALLVKELSVARAAEEDDIAQELESIFADGRPIGAYVSQ